MPRASRLLRPTWILSSRSRATMVVHIIVTSSPSQSSLLKITKQRKLSSCHSLQFHDHESRWNSSTARRSATDREEIEIRRAFSIIQVARKTVARGVRPTDVWDWPYLRGHGSVGLCLKCLFASIALMSMAFSCTILCQQCACPRDGDEVRPSLLALILGTFPYQ